MIIHKMVSVLARTPLLMLLLSNHSPVYIALHNGGAHVDIAAIGRNVYGPLPNGEYGAMSGTSLSAAQVSGAAGAVLAGDPGMGAAALKGRILDSADKLQHLQDKVCQGRGLNIQNAISNTAGAYLALSPEDDFDAHGYQPTPEESWRLFSGGEIVGVSAGDCFSLALMGDGSVWSFGANWSGQLGDGTFADKASPVQVLGLTNIVSVSAGEGHCLAVKADGSLWAWGNNEFGQAGDGTCWNERSTAVQVAGLSNVSGASAGGGFSLAVKA
ncbi:MAG: S8 family serine peptidase, partial [Oscillospiraceae bacterium]|nr:S8 family serine peptidase [Oscillospiraceae bacterium]